MTQLNSILRASIEQAFTQFLQAMGSGLNEKDQEWLTAHLQGFPAYLRTLDGGKVMTIVVDCYRASVENPSKKIESMGEIKWTT